MLFWKLPRQGEADMRNIVIGICSLTFFLVLLMIGYTVTGREKRTSELENALSLAMEQAIDSLQYRDEYSPVNDEELVAVFEQQLLVQLTAEADYEVRILDVDCEKGLLSAEVTEHYTHLNGREGSITVQRLAILDQVAERSIYGTKELTFWTEDGIYRRYVLEAGSALTVPRQPYMEDETFLGWRSLSDDKLYSEEMLSALTLCEDMSFMAEME
jgi:hypothetical protein